MGFFAFHGRGCREFWGDGIPTPAAMGDLFTFATTLLAARDGALHAREALPAPPEANGTLNCRTRMAGLSPQST